MQEATDGNHKEHLDQPRAPIDIPRDRRGDRRSTLTLCPFIRRRPSAGIAAYKPSAVGGGGAATHRVFPKKGKSEPARPQEPLPIYQDIPNINGTSIDTVDAADLDALNTCFAWTKTSI